MTNGSIPSLKAKLGRKGPALIAGAHSALSAKLVEEAGFDGVWASGFEISAARAVPDANILTMAEVLDVGAQMADAVDIPVIADCDNGFGNAVNVIRTVREFEANGIGGICIEDNIFPKRCSFYAGVKRELATPEEHAGKVRAALDARRSEDFVVIARTEALIAGWGLDEALHRARTYADAGADYVLIHSKAETCEELKAFSQRWDRETPLVAVPTIYKNTHADELDALGYRVVIFANHALRSSIKAMQGVLADLKRDQRPAAADPYVVPLDEVYRLVGVNQMKEQEKSYLPAGTADVRAIILAAGADKALLPLTEDRPACMLDVKGRTILERQVDQLNALGIKDIAVVRGYQKGAVNLPNLRYYDNDEYESTGELASLMTAREYLKGRVLVLYGDILFERHVLEKLLQSPAPFSIVCDRSWTEHRGGDGELPTRPDLVQLRNPSVNGARRIDLEGATGVTRIARGIAPQEADAEFIGMMMLDPGATERLLGTWDRLMESRNGRPFYEADSVRKGALTDLLAHLLESGEEIAGVEIYKGWQEVDSFEDYRRMWAGTRS